MFNSNYSNLSNNSTNRNIWQLAKSNVPAKSDQDVQRIISELVNIIKEAAKEEQMTNLNNSQMLPSRALEALYQATLKGCMDGSAPITSDNYHATLNKLYKPFISYVNYYTYYSCSEKAMFWIIKFITYCKNLDSSCYGFSKQTSTVSEQQTAPMHDDDQNPVLYCKNLNSSHHSFVDQKPTTSEQQIAPVVNEEESAQNQNPISLEIESFVSKYAYKDVENDLSDDLTEVLQQIADEIIDDFGGKCNQRVLNNFHNEVSTLVNLTYSDIPKCMSKFIQVCVDKATRDFESMYKKTTPKKVIVQHVSANNSHPLLLPLPGYPRLPNMIFPHSQKNGDFREHAVIKNSTFGVIEEQKEDITTDMAIPTTLPRLIDSYREIVNQKNSMKQAITNITNHINNAEVKQGIADILNSMQKEKNKNKALCKDLIIAMAGDNVDDSVSFLISVSEFLDSNN